MGVLGIFLFVSGMWVTGWASLWFNWHSSALEKIKEPQHAIGLPTGEFLLKLKLFKVCL